MATTKLSHPCTWIPYCMQASTQLCYMPCLVCIYMCWQCGVALRGGDSEPLVTVPVKVPYKFLGLGGGDGQTTWASKSEGQLGYRVLNWELFDQEAAMRARLHGPSASAPSNCSTRCVRVSRSTPTFAPPGVRLCTGRVVPASLGQRAPTRLSLPLCCLCLVTRRSREGPLPLQRGGESAARAHASIHAAAPSHGQRGWIMTCCRRPWSRPQAHTSARRCGAAEGTEGQARGVWPGLI